MANTTPFLPEFVNSFFHMAFMTAVPLLSVISGYLFFRRSTLDFKDLLYRRLVSVALPSWLWSALWLAVAFIFYSLGQSSGWFQWANYGFGDAGIMTIFNGVFGVTREPFAFQFWFVHDLLLTLLLAPILYFFLLWLGWRLLIIMALLWLLIPYPPVFYSGNVLMFFSVGAWLALPGSPGLITLLAFLQKYRWAWLTLFAAILALRIMSYKFTYLDDWLQGYVFLCSLRIIGVLAASALIYHMVIHNKVITQFLLRYSGYSFFIFAAHYPLIELLQGPVTSIPGYRSALGLTLSWFLIPLITIVLIIVLSRLFEKHFPAGFSVLNGGRHSQFSLMAATNRTIRPAGSPEAVNS